MADKSGPPSTSSKAHKLAEFAEGAGRLAPEILEDVLEEEIQEDMEDLNEDGELDDDELGPFEPYDPLQQVTQLLVTEEGTPIVDIMQGIQDALDKQNKILYKLVSVIESKQFK
jgi:hypothetical protein